MGRRAGAVQQHNSVNSLTEGQVFAAGLSPTVNIFRGKGRGLLGVKRMEPAQARIIPVQNTDGLPQARPSFHLRVGISCSTEGRPPCHPPPPGRRGKGLCHPPPKPSGQFHGSSNPRSGVEVPFVDRANNWTPPRSQRRAPSGAGPKFSKLGPREASISRPMAQPLHLCFQEWGQYSRAD